MTATGNGEVPNKARSFPGAGQNHPRNEPRNERAKVLVIDDESVVRELLSRMLATRGSTVDVAVNGEDGLAKVKQGEYDVIITDIKMPIMDGFQFIEHLKAFDPEIPVIIVTAIGDVQNAVKAIRLGAYDFIHKPFGSPETIWQPVARAIELRRAKLQNREYQRRMEEINKRLMQELEIARSVQENYAAKSLIIPEDGFDVVGMYEPCFDVGGDLYGAFPIGNQQLAMYIADVSGHGPAAALITAMIKVNLDNMADRKDLRGLASAPGEVLAELDRALVKCAGTRLFVTMFYGVLDSDTETLTYCNAGHCKPILLRAGTQSGVALDQGRGIPLATGFESKYESDTIGFYPGDLLVLYTDGLVEAGNPQDEQFGAARLARVIESSSGTSAQQLVQEISRNLKEFGNGVQPHDDVAVLLVRRKRQV